MQKLNFTDVFPDSRFVRNGASHEDVVKGAEMALEHRAFVRELTDQLDGRMYNTISTWDTFVAEANTQLHAALVAFNRVVIAWEDFRGFMLTTEELKTASEALIRCEAARLNLTGSYPALVCSKLVHNKLARVKEGILQARQYELDKAEYLQNELLGMQPQSEKLVDQLVELAGDPRLTHELQEMSTALWTRLYYAWNAAEEGKVKDLFELKSIISEMERFVLKMSNRKPARPVEVVPKTVD